MWFHIGANMDQRERVYIGTMTAAGLGVRFSDNSFVSLSSPENANRTIGVVDAALRKVNKQRADLGAYHNRLEHAIRGLDVGAENLQASESRIRDVDIAQETSNMTSLQILQQAGVSILSQANMTSQLALNLLQG